MQLLYFYFMNSFTGAAQLLDSYGVDTKQLLNARASLAVLNVLKIIYYNPIEMFCNCVSLF